MALLVAKAEAVQNLVSERHGSIVVHERTAHPHHVHVADVLAGLGIAVKDRETVQIGGLDVSRDLRLRAAPECCRTSEP